MLRLRLESFFAFLALCSDGSYRRPNSWRHECGTVNRSPLNEECLLLEPSSRNRKQVGHESFGGAATPTAVLSIRTNVTVEHQRDAPARWAFPSDQRRAFADRGAPAWGANRGRRRAPSRGRARRPSSISINGGDDFQKRSCGERHDHCSGQTSSAPAICLAFDLSAPEVQSFGKSFASAEVGERRSSRNVCGETPDRFSPVGSSFPDNWPFVSDGVEESARQTFR